MLCCDLMIILVGGFEGRRRGWVFDVLVGIGLSGVREDWGGTRLESC